MLSVVGWQTLNRKAQIGIGTQDLLAPTSGVGSTSAKVDQLAIEIS